MDFDFSALIQGEVVQFPATRIRQLPVQEVQGERLGDMEKSIEFSRSCVSED